MSAGVDLHLLTPPQRRVYHELLAVDAARPPADPGLAGDVRAFLDARTAPAAGARPPGARGLHLNKTALRALDCDGRYLDHVEGTFAWSPPTVLGTLVHRGIELDCAGRRRADAHTVVAHAWDDFCRGSGSAGRYLAGLRGVEVDALRAEVAERVLEFRECFPLLPEAWTVRLEPRLTVRLHGGAFELIGRPDLLLGRGHATERRMLLVDLKTGRRGMHHRADMRFYALLATLKYGAAPFRVATYYLDEADWDAEDVDAGVLEAAARDAAERAATAARLTWTSPAVRVLRLVAGPACRWCGRAAACSVRAETAVAAAAGGREGPTPP